jgi:UDP-glucose:(heptosyl)LPS alpha-1,3-glucosyltransferase
VRIGLVCRPFSFHGGVETATAGLMTEMVRRGYEVELLTTAAQGPVPGVSIRRLPVLAGPRLARLLSFSFAALRAGRAGTYDVLQSHERGLAQDVYRAGEGTHRGYLEATGRRGARASPYHRTVIWLERRIFSLRSARHVVAISEAGLREMARLYGTPRDGATLVYNGVDLERFHPDTRARLGGEARASLGLPSGGWVVLFVGSGFERKGLGPLVEAMARIGDARAWLAVAGKGHAEPYQRDAERLGLGGRVVWLGARPDVERLYAAADVVALPARYEPFGNVHLEALASGVPVLSSARAGGSELIRTGDNGWVVGEVTPALIADGLDRLRESDPTRLSAAARRSAEPFTYAAQVDAFTAIHRRLVVP